MYSYGPIVKRVNFGDDSLGNWGGEYIIFHLKKKNDIVVKIHARNFIKISRIEIIRLDLAK